MPIRPSDPDWAEETPRDAEAEVENEAAALDADDDPDACAGEEIEDPLDDEGDDDGA